MSSLPPLQARHYNVEMVTAQYLLSGKLEPFGALMIYLNHPERVTFLVRDVTATALDAANVAHVFHTDELWVYRRDISLLHPRETLSPSTMQLLPAKEKVRLVLPRFVVQATVYRGTDTAVGDMFDALSGYWIMATETQIFPLQPVAAPVFREAHQLLINRAYVQSYQVLKS